MGVSIHAAMSSEKKKRKARESADDRPAKKQTVTQSTETVRVKYLPRETNSIPVIGAQSKSCQRMCD